MGATWPSDTNLQRADWERACDLLRISLNSATTAFSKLIVSFAGPPVYIPPDLSLLKQSLGDVPLELRVKRTKPIPMKSQRPQGRRALARRGHDHW